MEKIKVAIIEDHNIVRQSLAKVLNMEFDMEVVGHWGSAEKAIEFLKTDPCDVVIMDLKIPGISGIDATRILIDHNPLTKVIALTAYSDEQDVFQVIQAGVIGYLPKEITIEDLVGAIRSVYRGYAALDPSITMKVLERFASMYERIENSEELSGLEKKILSLTSEGLVTNEIAKKLNVKPNAVKTHFREIFRKLNARDRAHAVAVAFKQGLI